ncbi:MAG: response regulator transcription factor, partial [Alphaproteobacteria bacterium]|nr:response regulator transcription factor [Alphaproteobacteria bacterium]
NLGADDYVTKPFNSSVLEARINACLRKGAIQETGEPSLVNGLLRMDLVRHQVYLDETLIALTPKEYNLLRYLMIHRGKMLTQKQILTEVWGPAHSDDSQYLRVFIGQIRAKIEKDPANPVVITTEPGVGYRMEEAA